MAQGRCSACVMSLAVLLMSVAAVQGATHVVGGSDEWKAPGFGNTLNTTYLQTWAANQTFAPNDVLEFIYYNAVHDVLQVSQADYSACNISNPIKKYTTGNDNVTIAAGSTYFVCGTPTHCGLGQKVNISTTGKSAAFGNSVTSLQALVAVTLSVVASLALWT